MQFLKTFLEPLSYFIYAVVFFLKLLGDSKGREKVLFIYYLFATMLAFVAYFIYAYMPMDVDNNWVYNILYLLTICILSVYFYNIFDTKMKKITVLVLLAINCILFLIFDIILERFFSSFNEYVFAIAFLSVVIYTLFYYDQLLRHVTEVDILSQLDFWIVSGYLLYFLGSFVIILSYLTIPVDERGPTWAFQNIILFISSLITLTGYLRIRYSKVMS